METIGNSKVSSDYRKRLSSSRQPSLDLLFVRRSNRADIGASAAFGAFAGVDHIFVGTLTNCVNRAFRLTSAAADAFIINLETHGTPPSLSSLKN